MENSVLELYADLLCCISKHLLKYTSSESQGLKVFKVSIDRALKENRFDKLKIKENSNE